MQRAAEPQAVGVFVFAEPLITLDRYRSVVLGLLVSRSWVVLVPWFQDPVTSWLTFLGSRILAFGGLGLWFRGVVPERHVDRLSPKHAFWLNCEHRWFLGSWFRDPESSWFFGSMVLGRLGSLVL